MSRPFRLRLWFAVTAFAAIAAIFTLSAIWVADFITRTLLERESEVSQEFLESIVRVEGPAVFIDVDPAAPPRALQEFAKHILSMPGILRANIHAADHRILWSTEAQLIGQRFESNDELDQALRGLRVTEIGTLPDPEKLEHVALGASGHFIEAYIPIRSGGPQPRVLGVVELYKVPTALDEAIQEGRRIVWGGALLAALVLFASLYGIVQRGARLIESQQNDLARMEAFAAIGQMASAVAHSLRNPMSAIRSTAELLGAGMQADTRQTANEVIHEVDRMDSYVRDLLAYAKSEPYALQPVDPGTVLSAVVVKSKAALARHNITVEGLQAGTAALRVMAEEMLLEQALTSLVTNAIEAMPDGGTLRLAVAPAAAGRVAIRVTDNGRGIPGEVLERVATAYFTTKVRGLGLGLVLARNIIERFGGTLQIESGRGGGTTVTIDLGMA